MVKIQFGSGGNILPGWTNLQESNGDITKTLPYGDESVDYILAEHVVEHVTHQEAWRFFKECQRVLKTDGVLRVVVPDLVKIFYNVSEDYKQLIAGQIDGWLRVAGIFTWHGGEVTHEDIVKSLIFCHGHKACWTEQLLIVFLEAQGFHVKAKPYGKSHHSELNNVDGHWKVMGLDNCIRESSVVEAIK